MVLGLAACATRPPTGVQPPVLSPATDAFLDTVQHRTFDYFWETANPANGLVPDRYPTPTFSSIAAVGFGLTAYPIGVEHGWITREAARARVLTTLRFLWTAPEGDAPGGMTGYHGLFYHFLDMQSGARFETMELSTIDTALLFGGVLFCRSISTKTIRPRPRSARSPTRSIAASTGGGSQPRPPLVSMGWTPEDGFHTSDWRGYNEAMLVYILALGSPTHAIDSDRLGMRGPPPTKAGVVLRQPHVGFRAAVRPPVHRLWIDFRGIRDAYMRAHDLDYFENSRRATRAQRAYAIDNPAGWAGYSAQRLGTERVGRAGRFHARHRRPHENVHAATRRAGPTSPACRRRHHRADGGRRLDRLSRRRSPFRRCEAMRRAFGGALSTDVRFRRCVQPDAAAQRDAAGTAASCLASGWVDVDYLGIDEGPIVAMIENYRSDLVWR